MKNRIRYAIGLGTVILLRLIPHPPNVEPVTASLLPFGKRFGWLSGALFAIVSVLAYDLITGTLGPWSLLTMCGFALVGAGSQLIKGRGIWAYPIYAIIATLVFDAITGIGVGVLIFGQKFVETLILQIPFTIAHLIGNVVLSLTISPLLERWIVTNPKLARAPVHA